MSDNQKIIQLQPKKYARIKALTLGVIGIIPLIVMIQVVKSGADLSNAKNLIGSVYFFSFLMIVIVWLIKLGKELMIKDEIVKISNRIGFWRYNLIQANIKDLKLEIHQDESRYYVAFLISTAGELIILARTPTRDKVMEIIEPIKDTFKF